MSTRIDLEIIEGLIGAGGRVLDIGCGDGDLLMRLAKKNGTLGRGIELSQTGVNACVAKGLSVIQGDADTDLADYPDTAFDYAVLSQTLQAVHRPRDVLSQMLRIARYGIVSFPNFGYWRVRLDLALGGRMPKTGLLPYQWYDTPNIHLCTIGDFVALCAEMNLKIVRCVVLSRTGRAHARKNAGRGANMFAEQAVFLLSSGGDGTDS